MQYDDVKCRHEYIIQYHDPKYPCGCSCHKGTSFRKHVKACCKDNSYAGVATCFGKLNDMLLFTAGADSYLITASDIVEEHIVDGVHIQSDPNIHLFQQFFYSDMLRNHKVNNGTK